MIKKHGLVAALMCLGLMALGETAPVFQVPKLSQAPGFDGKESSAWQEASSSYGFYSRVSGNLGLRQGRTLFGYDDHFVYFRVETELPPRKERLLSSVCKQDGKVYRDDSIELWLARDGQPSYYQYMLNLRGTVLDIKHTRGGGMPDEGWTAEWKRASWLDEGKRLWIAVIGIPLKDLGIAAEPAGQSFSVLISRNWQRPSEQTPFIPNSAPFDNLSRYARFVLNPDAPAIQIEGLGELSKQFLDLKGTILNKSKVLRTYRLGFAFVHSDMPETQANQLLTVKPGEQKAFHFHDDGGHIHARARHLGTLTIREGEKEVYRGVYNYQLPRNLEEAWKISGSISSSFLFSVYPGLNKAGIRFEAEKQATAATVDISLSGKTMFEKTWAALKEDNSFQMDIPSLKTGTYVIRLTIRSGDKILRRLSRTFERKVFPWENNTLGITDKVYAPFKDLQVSGKSLKTVLNQVDFDDTGFYADVKPEGRSILRGKVSLQMRAAGRPGRITASQGGFSKVSPAECVFEGESKTDCGFGIRTVSKTEYDGCSRFEMTLYPEPGKRPVVDSLYMDIPLDFRQVSLLHVIKAASIRSNPALRLPEGEGVIWKSTDVSNNGFYGNMHIYLWLGQVGRGLAWFADNDRHFSVDDQHPVQELIRHGEVLTLRVHFVNRPLTLTGPRTIVFGMQASPVKPMPQDCWKPRLVIPPHGGSNAYWGIRPAYAGKYPVGYEWAYVDEMVKARETGKINSSYIDDFLKRHYGTLPQDRQRSYRAHAYGGHLGMMAHRGKNPAMLYFEEHCQDQTTPEWETFQDEWGQAEFTPRRWMKEAEMTTSSASSSAGIGITPVRSYRDFTMWMAREWLRRGIGIYCDNTYPRMVSDVMNSNAYVREDGTVQPSSDIWAMRAYHKRLWQLTKQMQETVTWPLMVSLHITNGMILPIVCWTDIQLDLEWGWASGFKPFPIELLEIETTGRQIGVYPHAHFPIVGCGLVHEDPTYLRGKINEDMVRTDWAMRLIFGVLRYSMRGENFEAYNKIVNDFGLGTVACQVHEYWSDDFPLEVQPGNVKSILLRKGKEAILVMASWNEKPTVVTVKGREGLRLLKAQGNYPAETLVIRDNAFQVRLGTYGMQLIRMEVN